MIAFVVSMLIGVLLGRLGLVVSWIVGGIAVSATAVGAMIFPPQSPSVVWLALAVGIVGYNAGLLLALAWRFRRAEHRAGRPS
jgi:hydrogenase/urease accessory protein HupE